MATTKRSAPKPPASPRATERALRLARLEVERRALEADLLAFVDRAWAVVEPTRPFERNWHHELIAEYLELVGRGTIRRLAINIPPRFTKSRLVAVLWPVWRWTVAPETTWIFGSYAERLAIQHSVERRTILASDWYQERWGDRVEFAGDQNQKTIYQNVRRGQMLTTSVGGTVMGFGADTIVVDDPHNPQQVLSEVERETALRWYDQQLSTRLNDPKRGAIVVIMQRLHQLDLTGHVLEHGGWTHVALAGVAEREERVVFPVSGRVVVRDRDALLWPARLPAAALAEQRTILGEWAYAGQIQQRPTPLGGGIFKREWFKRFWTRDSLPARFDELVQSWDCAFKDLKDSDYVVGQLWGRLGADYYLLDQIRGQMAFTATLAVIEHQTGGWKAATTKLVEDKANGPAVVDTLKSRVPGLIAIEPEGGKIARAYAVSPLVEAGNVVLPQDAVWVDAFLHEITSFPTAAHDDQVDAMTQALHRMKTGAASGAAWIQFTQEQARGDREAAEGVARGTTRTIR